MENKQEDDTFLICSECFIDEGLKIEAFKSGKQTDALCDNCGKTTGRKLSKNNIIGVAVRFFVYGTTVRYKYGAAPAVQLNEWHCGKTDIAVSGALESDVTLIEKFGGVGLFYYGPRLWMIGEVEPLKELQDPTQVDGTIKRIIKEYPFRLFAAGSKFYRLRVGPENPADKSEYDSPPSEFCGRGRFDSSDFPVMYGSQDIDICIHECRATADDELYIATLIANRDLRLLDLSKRLVEEDNITEFDSLDMAVHMLFLARSHSYEIARAIALAAKAAGYDGVIYPSYFSFIRTGGRPFETTYGLSHRRYHPQADEYVSSFTIENLALFGRPVLDGICDVNCINKLFITQVGYVGHFGPVSY